MNADGPFDGTQVPMVLGSLRGLRTWNLEMDGTLHPRFKSQEWKPGENQGVCKAGTYSGKHKAGTRSCTCGFYAYYHERDVAHLSPDSVFGVIEAWGRVSLGSDGFRAEKAKIIALYNPYLTSNRIPQTGGDSSPKVHWIRRMHSKIYHWTRFSKWRLLAQMALIVSGFIATIVGGVIWDFPVVSNIGIINTWMGLALMIGCAVINVTGRRMYPQTNTLAIPMPQISLGNLRQWHATGRLPNPVLASMQSTMVPQHDMDAMALHYRDVPIYTSIREMLEEHPPTSYKDVKHLGEADD